jgi:hypothetical protein
MHAGFRRRHAHHAEEGREPDLEAVRPTDAVPELPVDRVVAPAVRHPPGRGLDLVDRDHERLPGLGAANEDRAGERVSVVELGTARGEVLSASDVPGVVRGEEADGVAWVDLDCSLQVP